MDVPFLKAGSSDGKNPWKERGVRKVQKTGENVRWAYHKEFLKHGKVNSKRQCRYVRPVAMGLVNKELAEEIVADLNQMCVANDYKLGTGFLTTYKLLSVLIMSPLAMKWRNRF